MSWEDHITQERRMQRTKSSFEEILDMIVGWEYSVHITYLVTALILIALVTFLGE
jgi:hypothetical protein